MGCPKISSLTIAISAYNEEGNIEKAVRDAFYVLPYIAKKYEVLVVDDGSTDKTLAILKRLKKEFKKLRIISHERNMGIGMANYNCYSNSLSDYIFWNAADNQIPMEELFKLIPYASEYEIVVGHRLSRKDPLVRRINSRLYNLLLRLLFNINIVDIDSVKLFNRKIFEKINIQSRSAFIETEIIIKAKKAGFKIIEVPIKHLPRNKGKPSGNKIKIITGQLSDLLKFFLRLNTFR